MEDPLGHISNHFRFSLMPAADIRLEDQGIIRPHNYFPQICDIHHDL